MSTKEGASGSRSGGPPRGGPAARPGADWATDGRCALSNSGGHSCGSTLAIGGARFGRIDVRSQLVARNAGGRLDGEDMFGGERTAIAQPFVDRRLPLADQASESGLRSDPADGLGKWSVYRRFDSHKWRRIGIAIDLSTAIRGVSVYRRSGSLVLWK